MKQKKNFLYFFSRIVIFIIQFFCIRCKVRLDIKEFVERELAKDYSNTVVLYDTFAKGYNNTVYVPSKNDITGTVNIKNEYNVGYTAHLTLDNPSQASCFNKAPEITVTEAGKFQFKFQFNASADAGGTEDNTGGKGAMVPVTVKLIKKEGGALFAEKRFTIRCNTPPASPTLDVENDVYTITKPADTDFTKCETTFYYGTDYKKASDWSCSDGTAKRRGKEYMHDARISIEEANGDRKLVAYALDTAGLKSEPLEKTSSYSYSSDTNFKVTTQETDIGSPTKIMWMFVPGGGPQGTKIDYPYRLAKSSFTIKIIELADGATATCDDIQYSNENNTLTTEIADDPNSDNQKIFHFTVTAEDEKTSKTYTLVLGRKNGFEVHFQCKTKSGGSPAPAFTASADVGKMSGLSVKDYSNLFLKKDLTGKNELTVKITGISNPLTKITLKKDNSVPEDPGETVLASGEKDLKGYTFTVPMVQESTLTFYFDDTLSFSSADGTVTIPRSAAYPAITIKLVDGELEMQHSSSTGGFSGSVDFTANPVLDMITKFNATTNHGNIFTSDADDLTITEIHLPTAVKTLSNPDGNGETFRSMRALQKVYFPKGFEGDLFSKLGIFVFRYSRKLEEFIFDESPRYIMDSYGNLLERLKDGNGNYSSQCQIIQGLKQKAGTITVNQSGGSVSIPREKAAVIKNGSSYTITKIRSEAFFEDSEHLAYIIIDCPTLEHIEKGNFMLFYAPPTAMYINACTPGAHQFKKEDFVPFWTSNDMRNFMMYVNTNDDAVLSKYKSWGSDETESSPGGATMNTIRPAHIIKQLFTINYP